MRAPAVRTPVASQARRAIDRSQLRPQAAGAAMMRSTRNKPERPPFGARFPRVTAGWARLASLDPYSHRFDASRLAFGASERPVLEDRRVAGVLQVLLVGYVEFPRVGPLEPDRESLQPP